MRNNTTAGFTLVEILITIGIIALLAGIVLVAINPARQFAQGRNTQRSAHINAVLNAIGQYQVDHQGDIPEDIPSGNDESDAEEISSAAADICEDIVPVYMAALPVDPSVGDEVVEEDSCGEYATGYQVYRDSGTGRITVIAPLALDEEALGEDVKLLKVTR